MYGWEATVAFVAFRYEAWNIQLRVPMPPKEDFTYTPTGQARHQSTIDKEHAQALRQRWRALHLVIQAKFEAIDCGITTFEEEFLAHIVTPTGLTVGQYALPKLKEAIETGKMPKALIAGIDSEV